jgi:N-acetylglucosamine-6-phosphate deacetylase
MKDNGIIGSIGHSDAVYAEVLAAVENGYTMITHFFNGMSRLVRKNAKMYLGVSESGLCFDDLAAEIIADGCHLPPELLRLIYKVKGPDRICLVTDSMRAAGQKVTESILGSKKNGQKVEIESDSEHGVAYMPGRASFGGSIATANRLVYTMNRLADVPMTEAVKMMTLTPARFLNLDNRIGSIASGKDADIIIFDEQVKMKLIMIKGKIWLNTL